MTARPVVGAWFPACVLLTTGALGQEATPEVETVFIDVPRIQIASADVRSLGITLRLDLDQDQYLTTEEVDTAIAAVRRHVAADQRRARTSDWLRQSRALTHTSAEALRIPGVRIKPTSARVTGFSSSLDWRRLEELRVVRQQVVVAGSDLSLVSRDFHALFSHLPPEQRHALLEADVAGDNDGTLTVREFYFHNRRPLSKKTHFESDFGEEAYLEVLRLLGVL